MAERKWCFDTYALIEIAKGNEKFARFLNGSFVVTDITLAEFYAVLLREHDEKTADYWFGKFEAYSLPVDKRILIEAVKFRYEHRKADISFFDAVGYVFSVSEGYRFVTGDKEFEGREGVAFQKK